MKEQKKFWEVGKFFDYLVVVGYLQLVVSVGYFSKGVIMLLVNGQVKQSSDLLQMIWLVVEQIVNFFKYYELFFGDLIYLGMLENVGFVVLGDVMFGYIDGLNDISVKVV